MWNRFFTNVHSWLRAKNIKVGSTEYTTPEYSLNDYWNFEHFRIPAARKVLYSFRDKEEVEKWKVTTDATIGGFSHATLRYDETVPLETTPRQQDLIGQYYFNPSQSYLDNYAKDAEDCERIKLQTHGCAQFFGTLSLELPPGAEKSGFASFKGPVAKLINLDTYDGLELRIKTDGRLYVAQIKLESKSRLFISVKEDELFQFIIPPCKPDTWTQVILPFNDFILTWRGYQRDQDEVLDKANIKQISFLMAERSDGPFNLHIDWIHAVKFDGSDRFLPYRYKGETCSIQTRDDMRKANAALEAAALQQRREQFYKDQEKERGWIDRDAATRQSGRGRGARE